ncbi:uncharacterized protein LOC121774831 [Salvia splendens]|uniref:uncharacterized protein LOC121774831 n=1 Tax=Salvia splendens TaxID=180675 RepID=UPI001C25E1FC|nr:uncharacterized protein LOC121774831 [Salvia splendens]
MDRNTFDRLCRLLYDRGGLRIGKVLRVEEQGCVGALDDTHILVLVSSTDKPRYQIQKGLIATNTLAICDHNMQFLYVLIGWERLAGDSCVLRDAVSRVNGLKVPKGYYYLCDNGYANSNGFLTPFRGVRYHLKEWGPGTEAPQNAIEMIFRSSSFYPIKTQVRLIAACFLLHNFIRREMPIDPIEVELDGIQYEANLEDEVMGTQFLESVEPSND